MGKAGLVRLGLFLVRWPWAGRAEGRPEAAPGPRELADVGRQVAWGARRGLSGASYPSPSATEPRSC